jgi:hypothetical protein
MSYHCIGLRRRCATVAGSELVGPFMKVCIDDKLPVKGLSRRLLGFILLLGLFALGQQERAFAQAGSTGGTIGNQDKSISGGGEERREPQGSRAKPSGHHSGERQGLPQTIRLSESSIAGSYSITLRHTGGNAYEGTWNVGIVSRMTISMTNATMVIERHDVSNPTGPLYSPTYSGARAGNSASGSYLNGTWQASW